MKNVILNELIVKVIFIIYKKCKRKEEVETALEMEKNKNVEEAEVSRQNKILIFIFTKNDFRV